MAGEANGRRVFALEISPAYVDVAVQRWQQFTGQEAVLDEVLKAQERRIRLAKLKGTLIDRDRATALVFRLAREERDAWVNWPARAAALMAAELGTETAAMQKVLEAHVRAQLEELAQPRIAL